MWVDTVKKGAQKEDLSVLLGIRKIKEWNEKDRLCFLEVFNNKLQ